MKCKNCGAEINSHENICPHCGEYLKKESSQTMEERKTNMFVNKGMENRAERKSGVENFQTETNPLKRFFNFDNIGEKIKNAAKLLCWIEIIIVWAVSAVLFVICIFENSMRSLGWVFLLAAIVLPFVIWISSWFMYSIGNFIENDEKRTQAQMEIAEAMKKKDE